MVIDGVFSRVGGNVMSSAAVGPETTIPSLSYTKMRYLEMPRDVSCDSLAALRINESVMDSDDEEERSSGCGGGRGMAMPMCARGTSPPSSVYRKVVQETNYDSPDSMKALTKAAYSYGTLPRIHSHKSASLPARGKDTDNPPVLDLLRVVPEDLATQITRMDFPVFKSITPEELTSCGWTKKDKLKSAPNVVEFTRRFNHVSFWVVREILNAGGVKHRAEMMGHFVKVAKKLNELHNFHSQFAIISALQSAPIYRLNKTWAALSRKDRQHFDRMTELFSDKNNWEQLRSLVNSLKLPMIPYLGLFLTDLVYIDMAHPHFGGLESEQRQLKMNNILRVLADYQQSDYSALPHLQHVQAYLASVRYIEELQKFVEDDHYKLSLQLEPNTPSSSHSASKDSVADAAGGISSLNVSPSARMGVGRPPAPPPTHSCPTHGQQGKFVPTHRKARSLGTKFRSMSLPRNLHRSEPQTQGGDRFGIFKGCSGTSEGMRCDSVNSLGSHEPGCPSAQGSQGSRHLLDDSELDPPPPPHHDCTSPPSHTLTRTWSGLSSDSDTEVVFEVSGEECGVQGPLRRKTVIKDGRRPAVAAWHRYWVQLWGGALVYYHPKSLTSRGQERADFKTSPCKLQPLVGPGGKLVLVGPHDAQSQPDVFQLSDPAKATIYKFRAPSVSAAKSWISNLQQALSENIQRPPETLENLMTFE
ncbi:ras-specific guanine nucleotide-releasing factor RalGPS1-like isoform X3 [Homarus americanus]|uniref:ras-specific guanine nucleotide-releasing factor RalGPS1-like isoform X3 n=1 Tax=Homarus americanus TaxID=6706 RepID=UPI001C4587B1|nr:ras-specific guanine nucleotide-releasing factor RalGPS1-like isoform X3 [Homarus americanus]